MRGKKNDYYSPPKEEQTKTMRNYNIDEIIDKYRRNIDDSNIEKRAAELNNVVQKPKKTANKKNNSKNKKYNRVPYARKIKETNAQKNNKNQLNKDVFLPRDVKSDKIALRVTPEVKAKLKQLAETRNQTLGGLINEIIEEYLILENL